MDKIQTCSLDTHVTICRNYYYHPTTLQSVHPSEVPLFLFRMTGSPRAPPGVSHLFVDKKVTGAASLIG